MADVPQSSYLSASHLGHELVTVAELEEQEELISLTDARQVELLSMTCIKDSLEELRAHSTRLLA